MMLLNKMTGYVETLRQLRRYAAAIEPLRDIFDRAHDAGFPAHFTSGGYLTVIEQGRRVIYDNKARVLQMSAPAIGSFIHF